MRLMILVTLFSSLSLTRSVGISTACDELPLSFPPKPGTVSPTNSTLRRVDLEAGRNSIDCLNYANTSCRTLHYALHETEENIGGPVNDLIIELGPGVYRSINETTTIINSSNLALIGAGVSETIIVCGANGSRDVPCNYLNFQIRDSSNILISGITFTGCGPITSSLYISLSDFIFIDKCSFENNTSPSVLINNTPNIAITNTSFLHNTPAELSPEIVHNRCYFTRSVVTSLYVDNRTTSGGVSIYIEGSPAGLVIEDCLFYDNSARNDSDTGLVRQSEGYGQAGALNIRLKNSIGSTVCIRRNRFFENSAEAHAGALGLSLADSTGSRFIISDSIFDKNWCVISKCTGGAVGISLISGTRSNTILFQDSNFTENRATSSGAIVMSTSVSAIVDDCGLSDTLKLINCLFIENMAFFEGTALGVFSLSHSNEIGIPVDIVDCHFIRNQGSRGSSDTTAVTVYRVQLSFYGSNSFESNQGGGASLLTSRMDIRGNVTFNGNEAVFGAGVAMSGRSLFLLYENSYLLFANNFAKELGAGLYVEYTSSDFIQSILNTGCFIRYSNSSVVDSPPTQWKTKIIFVNNTATIAGAAIYANDMSRCRWLGHLPGDYTIFQIPPEKGSPFLFENNTITVTESDIRGNISNQVLATNPSIISAKVNLNSTSVSYGERLSFILNSEDELQNFREAVWSINAPDISQRLGSLSSNATVYSYRVPPKSSLMDIDEIDFINDTARFKVTFFLLQNEAQNSSIELVLEGCHPGYIFDEDSQTCVCNKVDSIVRCDLNNRYFYVRDGFWVGINEEDGSPYFASTIPGFLSCSRLGTLPGCLFKFDDKDEQCALGRSGELCGNCQSGYGVTFDLRSCRNDCGIFGILLFIVICIATPIVSLAVLYYDFPIPNELKGVIFYAQVVGVIFRSTPYLLDVEPGTSIRFFDFVINMFGFAMPFPVCIHEKLPVVAMAFLGYIPPFLAMLTAIFYSLCANKIKMLSQRENYGFHGFYFLLLFVYKYIVDTSFIFVSCTSVNGESLFFYQGAQKCRSFPFILIVLFGALVIILFGVILPVYVLKVLYAPKKMLHVQSSLTHGLKDGRRYLWYGVWEIWRRLLFVGANLFIQITTRSVVLFIHSLLILLCLLVLCFVKPYKKYHINLIENFMILCLFGTTLAIYDRDNDLYVGKITGTVTIILPFAYGAFFIIYRTSRIIIRKTWPKLNKRFHLDEKFLPFTEKYLNMVSSLREKTVGLIGEDEEDEFFKIHKKESISLGTADPFPDREIEQSYAPDLRESLLDDDDAVVKIG